MNQTSKSKSPGRGNRGGLGCLAVGEELGPVWDSPIPGPRHQFMMQLRFRVMK